MGLLKNFRWRRRMQFWIPCRKIVDKRAKYFCSISVFVKKNFKNDSFSSNCSSGHTDCSFDNPKQYSTGNRKGSAQGSEFFGKKNVIPKNFLWKLKMQFWQHSCKNSGTYSKLLALLSANSLPYFFLNRLSSNCSYWQKGCSFDKPVNNFSKEVSFFCSIFKIFGKNAVFLENVFLLKVLMENFNAFLTSPLRKI